MLVGPAKYRLGRVTFYVKGVGSYTVAALWREGTSSDDVARQFISEAQHVFQLRRPSWKPRKFTDAHYSPPMACVTAMTAKLERPGYHA